MENIILKELPETVNIVDFENEVEDGELTVIRIIAKPNVSKYSTGWWVQLLPEIYIRPVGTKDKLGLIYAFNIPIAPAKYFFKNQYEQLHFTLFFPALPKSTTHIDIIEQEGGSRSEFFNFYSVPVSKIRDGKLHG